MSDSKSDLPKKHIKVFKSFEEAEAHELEQRRAQDPLERLAQTTALIKKIYNYTPKKYYRIYFH